MNQGSESGRGSKVMWGTESCVSPTDPWIGQQNTKLSSDSWKEGPVCSHGLEGSTAGHRQSWKLLEHSGNSFLAQVVKKTKRENPLMDLIPKNLE